VPAHDTQLTFVPALDTQLTFVPALDTQLTFVPALDTQLTFVPALDTQLTFVPAPDTQLTFAPAATFARESMMPRLSGRRLYTLAGPFSMYACKRVRACVYVCSCVCCA